MFKQQVSGVVAAGDTAKTSLGTLIVPGDVSKIVGLYCHAVGGPGNTTLENITGIFELESPTDPLPISQFLLDPVVEGVQGASLSAKPWPCDISVRPGMTIQGFITMDMAITLANTCRFQVTYE
ncbi:unnamed protein product [marine sediment metagenome]|uniref:Uncharacterized protein n=1 Tax=marine sediment metagenome TaxID=412755 RepID=X1JJY2_9ZZZZ